MKRWMWVTLIVITVGVLAFFGIRYLINTNKDTTSVVDNTVATEVITTPTPTIEAATATPTTEPTATPTAKPTEVPTTEPTATPTAKPTEVPMVKTTAIPTITVVTDSSEAIGFTPDKDLLISDLKAEKVGLESASLTRDFQKYLNENRDGFGPLAGYTDGTNDYNQYNDHKSAPQVPAYSWMIHTGEYVEIPGIGIVTGEKGRGVIVLIINRTDKVYRFPTNSVTVIAGFQGWGRIWDGESKQVIETEKRLVNHYLTRLGEGVPETGFIGQTDNGFENALTVTVVTVEMLDVGQFRLIRAETVPAIK